MVEPAACGTKKIRWWFRSRDLHVDQQQQQQQTWRERSSMCVFRRFFQVYVFCFLWKDTVIDTFWGGFHWQKKYYRSIGHFLLPNKEPQKSQNFDKAQRCCADWLKQLVLNPKATKIRKERALVFQIPPQVWWLWVGFGGSEFPLTKCLEA